MSNYTVVGYEGWNGRLSEAYEQLLERNLSDETLEGIHNFLVKKPQNNILRCFEQGTDINHTVNLIAFYSKKQQKGDFFARSRNLPILYLSDLKYPESLLWKLKTSSANSFSGKLMTLFSSNLSTSIQDYDGSKASKVLRKLLVKELNRLMKTSSLYEDRFFNFETLPQEAQILILKEAEGEEIVILNRILLEKAFPKEIVKMRKKRNVVFLEDMDDASSTALVNPSLWMLS